MSKLRSSRIRTKRIGISRRLRYIMLRLAREGGRRIIIIRKGKMRVSRKSSIPTIVIEKSLRTHINMYKDMANKNPNKNH